MGPVQSRFSQPDRADCGIQPGLKTEKGQERDGIAKGQKKDDFPFPIPFVSVCYSFSILFLSICYTFPILLKTNPFSIRFLSFCDPILFCIFFAIFSRFFSSGQLCKYAWGLKCSALPKICECCTKKTPVGMLCRQSHRYNQQREETKQGIKHLTKNKHIQMGQVAMVSNGYTKSQSKMQTAYLQNPNHVFAKCKPHYLIFNTNANRMYL